ncbi:hypothetical protein [Bacillus sp. AK031]
MSKSKKDLTDPVHIKQIMISRLILIAVCVLILIIMAIKEFSILFALIAITVGAGNSIYLFKDIENLKNITD